MKKILFFSLLFLLISSIHLRAEEYGYDEFIFAMSLYKEKNYEQAINEFRRFIFLNKNSISAHDKTAEAFFWVAMSYYRTSEAQNAAEALNEIISNFSDTEIAPRAAFQLGKFYFSQFTRNQLKYETVPQKQFEVTADQVISSLLLVKEKFPKSELTDDAVFLAGEFYLFQKNRTRAAEFFSMISKNWPRSNKAAAALEKLKELSLQK